MDMLCVISHQHGAGRHHCNQSHRTLECDCSVTSSLKTSWTIKHEADGNSNCIENIGAGAFPDRPGFGHDMSPDGQKFLMLVKKDFFNSSTTLNVITNLSNELRRRTKI